MRTLEISRRTGDYYGDGSDNHIWEIVDSQGIAAELYVSYEDHEIMRIEVRKDRRGEGLARALYETAAERMHIFHAPLSHRTPDGAMFVAAVGGEELPCIHGCCYDED